MKTTYKLLSYSANKLPRAGVLVGDTVYDAQKATGVAAHANMLGLLADWAAAGCHTSTAASAIARTTGMRLTMVKTLC